jgi:hypothetical protein
MSADPQDDFEAFVRRTGLGPDRASALAFFVGYASGAAGVRQNIDEIVEAFRTAKTIEFPTTAFEGGPK